MWDLANGWVEGYLNLKLVCWHEIGCFFPVCLKEWFLASTFTTITAVSTAAEQSVTSFSLSMMGDERERKCWGGARVSSDRSRRFSAEADFPVLWTDPAFCRATLSCLDSPRLTWGSATCCSRPRLGSLMDDWLCLLSSASGTRSW